jgi:hypothetical protein
MEKAKSTSKTKGTTAVRATKPAVEKKTPKTVKAATSLPGENEIRIKAQEIYNKRIAKGLSGTAEQDWLKAEKLLKG